ncbi:MAG TPA: PepSY domain-containing protein [Candidatus Mediterraneibacter faecavium]|uniref:PepSY domain-containing protein n=1 Tax=Candidatus Mediterraneibacter faecavium TaxID=2838668 RepID=A0A9D2TN23_9FIRM|nr:PepSY domain-containing protein [Candidatus Mediterraneibacter faecavium]
MKKRSIIILAGMLFGFVMLTGCGMDRSVRQTRTTDDNSAQREQELQTEIDALQQEIDELKNNQGSQEQQSAEPADPGTAADDGQTSAGTQNSDNAMPQSDNRSNHHSSGGASNVAVSLEEAQNIALKRVPGATSRNISIELDYDDGWYIYEGDIVYDGMEYEFEIDADTGNILKWEEERW